MLQRLDAVGLAEARGQPVAQHVQLDLGLVVLGEGDLTDATIHVLQLDAAPVAALGGDLALRHATQAVGRRQAEIRHLLEAPLASDERDRVGARPARCQTPDREFGDVVALQQRLEARRDRQPLGGVLQPRVDRADPLLGGGDIRLQLGTAAAHPGERDDGVPGLLHPGLGLRNRGEAPLECRQQGLRRRGEALAESLLLCLVVADGRQRLGVGRVAGQSGKLDAQLPVGAEIGQLPDLEIAQPRQAIAEFVLHLRGALALHDPIHGLTLGGEGPAEGRGIVGRHGLERRQGGQTIECRAALRRDRQRVEFAARGLQCGGGARLCLGPLGGQAFAFPLRGRRCGRGLRLLGGPEFVDAPLQPSLQVAGRRRRQIRSGACQLCHGALRDARQGTRPCRRVVPTECRSGQFEDRRCLCRRGQRQQLIDRLAGLLGGLGQIAHRARDPLERLTHRVEAIGRVAIGLEQRALAAAQLFVEAAKVLARPVGDGLAEQRHDLFIADRGGHCDPGGDRLGGLALKTRGPVGECGAVGGLEVGRGGRQAGDQGQ